MHKHTGTKETQEKMVVISWGCASEHITKGSNTAAAIIGTLYILSITLLHINVGLTIGEDLQIYIRNLSLI